MVNFKLKIFNSTQDSFFFLFSFETTSEKVERPAKELLLGLFLRCNPSQRQTRIINTIAASATRMNAVIFTPKFNEQKPSGKVAFCFLPFAFYDLPGDLLSNEKKFSAKRARRTNGKPMRKYIAAASKPMPK